MAKHRTHSIEFKRQVAQEFLAGETLYGLAKRHDICRCIFAPALTQAPYCTPRDWPACRYPGHVVLASPTIEASANIKSP